MNTASKEQSPSGRTGFGLQPTDAWLAILAFTVLSAVMVLAGAGSVANLAFPAGATLVGFYLSQRHPILYLGFTWWIVLLSPLVRRMADESSGFTDPSPILLAPYLVVVAGTLTLGPKLLSLLQGDGAPYALALAGPFYATLIGNINGQETTIILVGLLDYACPILFSLYVYGCWNEFPAVRNNLHTVTLWAVLLLGAYGIYQYLELPSWDQYWLDNAALSSLIDQQGQGVRIWGTLNSPEPYGAFLAAAVLVPLVGHSNLRFASIPVGIVALLLTRVRSAWLGWAAGLLSLVISLKPKLQMRLVLTLLVMTLLVIPLATQEEFGTAISDRLQTLSNLEDDGSGQIRVEKYRALTRLALTSFLGYGIGGSTRDSALLGTLINLGWLGTLFYAGGLLLLIMVLFQGRENRQEPFVAVARAAVVSGLVRLPLNVVTIESNGLFFWGFLGAGLAARKYYLHQRNLHRQQHRSEGNLT